MWCDPMHTAWVTISLHTHTHMCRVVHMHASRAACWPCMHTPWPVALLGLCSQCDTCMHMNSDAASLASEALELLSWQCLGPQLGLCCAHCLLPIAPKPVLISFHPAEAQRLAIVVCLFCLPVSFAAPPAPCPCRLHTQIPTSPHQRGNLQARKPNSHPDPWVRDLRFVIL